MSRRIIIIDLNMFLNCIELGVNLFQELDRVLDVDYTPYVLDRIFSELKVVSDRSPKLKKLTEVARKLIEKCEIIETHDEKKPTDELIIEYAQKLNAIVATNDKYLRKRLRQYGIPTIYIRGMSHLEIELKSLI